MPTRLGTAFIGGILSIAVSIVLWQVFDTFLFFLFVPFVPFVLGRGRTSQSTVRTCPNCDFQTTDSTVHYCPYDGTQLSRSD